MAISAVASIPTASNVYGKSCTRGVSPKIKEAVATSEHKRVESVSLASSAAGHMVFVCRTEVIRRAKSGITAGKTLIIPT